MPDGGLCPCLIRLGNGCHWSDEGRRRPRSDPHPPRPDLLPQRSAQDQ